MRFKRSLLIYVAASYLFWIVLKVVGSSLFYDFTFKEEIQVFHGSNSLAAHILLSPLLMPCQLLMMNGSDYLTKYMDSPMVNVILSWAAFIISLLIVYSSLNLAEFILDKRRRCHADEE